MTPNGPRYPRALIQRLDAYMRDTLSYVTSHQTAAGSYRRELADCGDLDLVVEARPKPVSQLPMFAARIDGEAWEPFNHAMARIERESKVTYRNPNKGQTLSGLRGNRTQRFWPGSARDGCPHVDLYIVQPPAVYPVILAIRTGSAAWNAALMAWLKPRQEFTPDNAYRPYIRQGALWLTNSTGGYRLADEEQPQDEEALYDMLGIPYAHPPERETAADFNARVTPA